MMDKILNHDETDALCHAARDRVRDSGQPGGGNKNVSACNFRRAADDSAPTPEDSKILCA
jgi:hypothetical protein